MSDLFSAVMWLLGHFDQSHYSWNGKRRAFDAI